MSVKSTTQKYAPLWCVHQRWPVESADTADGGSSVLDQTFCMGWSDDEYLITELPTAHAVALRMQRSGADDERIADALGISIVQVAALLVMAELKLAELRRPQ